jgi:polysaccharide biosynthesis/export protein
MILSSRKRIKLVCSPFRLLFVILAILLSSSVLYSQDTPVNTSNNQTQSPTQVQPVQQDIPTPEQIQKDASGAGYSASELQRLGIDLSNPTQALLRARELGVPESDIQSYLSQYQSQNALESEGTLSEDMELPEEFVDETLLDEDSEEMVEEEPVEEIEAIKDSTRYGDLEYFGYGILRGGRGNYESMNIGPVDPGYVIGTGDVLRLYLWGDVEFQYEMTVNRDGNINIPKAGQFFAAGTKLENLRDKLHNYLSKFYSGLTTDPPTVFMDISIARIRGNQIYIMGEVLSPGSITISSFATVFNLMYATGGPSYKGSMRDIRVLRDSKIVSHIDLYDYLLKGVSTDDKRLRNGDIIFVPPRNNSVAIKGLVNRPGIYETTKKEDLKTLIDMAGGLKTTAYSFRMQIDRIIPIADRVKGAVDRELIDINLNDVMNGKVKTKLVDGDIITVLDYSDILVNYVDIDGSGIARPGRYQLGDIVTVSDLIIAADSTFGNTYMLKGDIVRIKEDLTEEFLEFDINEALNNNPTHNIALFPMDRVRIYSRIEWDGMPTVRLRGAVVSPGTYPLPENLTLYDLLFAHAGLQDSIRIQRTYMDRGDIYRLTDDAKTYTKISFNLRDVWDRKVNSNIKLVSKDIVVVYGKSITEIFNNVVSISGNVRSPGSFPLSENMNLADLLILSGGFTQDAWLFEAEISRIDLKGTPGDELAKTITVPIVDWQNMSDNPEDMIPDIYLNQTPAADFLLHPYDKVRIRSNPDFEIQRTVSINGEVKFSGEYTLINKLETLSEVITRAGGLTSNAYAGGGRLTRDDGTRLFIDFNRLLIKNDKKVDIILMPGDVISIPKQPFMVSIDGEIENPGYFKYVAGKRVKDYVKEAGGKTENGGKIYVTYPSGYTYSSGFMRNPKVVDGSTIRVLPIPPKEEKDSIDWTSIIKDTLAILASAATVIAVIDRTGN